MALTPIDVQQKTFGTALRGYDLDEVDDFLDEVVTSLKGYELRLVEAQARIQALEIELAGKGDSESAISRALVAAQRSADMIIEDANREADRLLTDARTQAEMLAAVREEERAKLALEVSSMKAGVAEIRDKVKALAGSMESDLEEMDRSVATAEAHVLGDQGTAPGDASSASTAGVAGGIAAFAADSAADADSSGGPDMDASDLVAQSVSETATETVIEAESDGADAWFDQDGQGEGVVEQSSDVDSWVTPQPDDMVESLPEPRSSAAQWAPSLSDEIETAVSRDPLEEALAEATFAGLEGLGEADVEAAVVDAAVDVDAIEEMVELDVDDGFADEEIVAASEALQADDVDAGEAWERAGLEGWGEETTPTAEDDRPRRPWE